MTSVPFASETMKGEQAYSHSRGACIGIGRQSGPNNPDCQFPRLFVGQDGKRICDGGVERQCEQSLSHGQRIGAGHSPETRRLNSEGVPSRDGVQRLFSKAISTAAL
jgi:hypothetical protein